MFRAPVRLAWLLLGAALSACSKPSSSAPAGSPGGASADGGGEGAAKSGPACLLVDDDFGPKGQVPVRVEVVAKGLEVPWGIGFLPGGDMLVTERPGRVRRVGKDGAVSPPVAELQVSGDGEGGLLGLALAPDFATSRRFYLYVSGKKDDEVSNRIERWTLSEDGQRASFERRILEGLPGAKYHDGGRLRFGPDGMLYVGTGDAREPGLSQDPSSLAGKLLRLTPDGGVPADNPRPGSPAFLTGIRNLQAFDWPDPKDASRLYVADHGPSGDTGRWGHDEISVATRGQNLGWPDIYACETRAGMVTPSLVFDDAAPPGGAAIYTGKAIPEWRGSFLVGTLKSKHLQRVALDEAGRVKMHEAYFEGDRPEGFGRLREVVMGPDGELYVTTSNCDGRGECGPDRDLILRVTR